MSTWKWNKSNALVLYFIAQVPVKIHLNLQPPHPRDTWNPGQKAPIVILLNLLIYSFVLWEKKHDPELQQRMTYK